MTGQYLSKEKLAEALGDERCLWSAQAEQAGARETIASLTEPRSSLSPKSWLQPSLQSVGKYGRDLAHGTADAPPATAELRAVIGVRACELRAVAYLDRMLLEGEFQDPLYRQRREATVLVATDCTAVAETCFCTSLDGQPFADAGYDVNLSPISDGFVVDVATDRGRAWLSASGIELESASPRQIAERDAAHEAATELVRARNRAIALRVEGDRPLDLPNDDDAAWQRCAADCVECGACTNICPTCYCFYLYDQVLGPESFQRVRTWDSCILGTYHRMAGTTPNMKPTPRPRLRSRLANRILHKFQYAPTQCGMLGCVGCGRCIEACLGGLDLRRIVGEMQT